MEYTNKIQYILNNVALLSKKYEDIAKITGENFNVFSIMSMENDERYTHSAIIGELLNPKGSHGQGSVFLKLFFEEITILKSFALDFENAKIILEEHIGIIDNEYIKGGFIDIVIKFNNNIIVIENKIYANDQKNQLVRYKNHYPNCTLLYLNLFGNEPSNESKGDLVLNEDFHIISYQNEIFNWIEKCYKEAVEQPTLRETIKQYNNILKKLTNQTTNDKMSEEIINLISQNPNECFEIANNIMSFKKHTYKLYMGCIKNFALENEMEVNELWIEKDNYFGLFLKPKAWNENNLNICICVIFERSNYRGLYFGVSYEENLNVDLKAIIIEKFNRNNFKTNEWWIWRYLKNKDWEDNSKIWEDILKYEKGDTFLEITNGIKEILEIEKAQ